MTPDPTILDGGSRNIYLAARYSRRAELQVYAALLESLGCNITSRWILGLHDGLPKLACAIEDIEDMGRAGTLIAFTEPPGEATNKGRGGRHVEFGFMLHRRLSTNDVRLIVVGPEENVFHACKEVTRFNTFQDLLHDWLGLSTGPLMRAQERLIP